MIREEGPGVERQGALLGEEGEAGDEGRAVGVIPEAGPPLPAPHHHMVQGPGGIEAGVAGHGEGEDRRKQIKEAASRILSVIRVRKRLVFHSLSVTQPSWKITLFFASFRSTRQATHLAQVDEGDGSPGDLR
jgi:hypothetical protein